MNDDDGAAEVLGLLEEILDRVDRVDDWTYKLFIWVRAATITLMALAGLAIVNGIAG